MPRIGLGVLVNRVRTIGGQLDLAALEALSGNPDRSRMAAFHVLSRAEQANAIRRLATAGMTDYGIASATRLSVEFVRHVLAEHGAAP